MADIYCLFLDESETHDEDAVKGWTNIVFSIAGIIVKKEDHENIIKPEVNNIKQNVWHDLPDFQEKILHEKDIRFAMNPQNAHKLNSIGLEYRRFKSRKYVKMLYNGLKGVLSHREIITMGACVRMDDLNNHYPAGITTDKYLICLQILIENFCHFLKMQNAKGIIYYESINESQNNMIRRRFNIIENMGTMYIKPKAIQEYILNIHFPEKRDNIAGLQVADFIPNVYARKAGNKKLDRINLYQQIRVLRYDGGVGKYERYGIKVLP